MVAVRFRPEYLDRFFESCEVVAHVDNGFDIDNEAQGQPIYVCRGLRGRWEDLEPEMRYLS